jgi:hypothetical protein
LGSAIDDNPGLQQEIVRAIDADALAACGGCCRGNRVGGLGKVLLSGLEPDSGVEYRPYLPIDATSVDDLTRHDVKRRALPEHSVEPWIAAPFVTPQQRIQ